MNDFSEDRFSEDELHDLLATRAGAFVPGLVPTEGVLAGARRRRVRTRAVTATAGLLVVAGVATAVATGRGSSGGVASAVQSPATKAAKTHSPVVTRQLGLAPGQKASQANSGMDVIMSGTVDGRPWQLYGAAQVDPPEDGMWTGHAPAEAGKHVYCYMFGMEVGGKDRNQGGGGCGEYDFLNDPSHNPPIWVTSGAGSIPGDGTFAIQGVVAPEVAKLVWTGADGFAEETTPMLTPLGKLPFFVLLGPTPGPDDKVTAYDAAGNVVKAASIREVPPDGLGIIPPQHREPAAPSSSRTGH